MDIISILMISIGLAMDSFAVSICKGLSIKQVRFKHMFIIGAWFGVFQGIMPLLGYFLGNKCKFLVEGYGDWIAFALLLLVGLGMIKEALQNWKESDDELIEKKNPMSSKSLFLLAIATSIDAFAVGVSFAILDVNIILASSCITSITMTLSMIGVKIGSIVGGKYKAKAELAGGVILIIMGIVSIIP